MSEDKKGSPDTPASSSKALAPRSSRSPPPGAKRSSQNSSRVSSRSGSNGSVTNQYQFVPEPTPNAGVVAVHVERRTLLAENRFLEQDEVRREYARCELEIAQQRSQVEEQAELVERRAADVAREKEQLGQTAQQMSSTYIEAKDARERARVTQTKKEQMLEALEQKLDRNRAQQVRDAVRTHEELGALRQRECALRQQARVEEDSMQAATELLRQRH